ncbi:MAG: heparinase II/III family protein [Deltaproteobacteria bacterium]|nr:heparinase II/III family protein [Deltaproteobacteria bacterium]
MVDAGFPLDWHRNAFTGQVAPRDLHWSEISDFEYGDIKLIWEPSRFGFVYDLVRAYWRTGDEKYAQAFWRLVEDWGENNPPNCGVNWKCGQEISFRVMAWCFGLYGFGRAAATHAGRVVALAEMIAVSAERIEGNIGYALNQRNNHGISEALGLWTVGVLFPELRKAVRWREKGRRFLEEQARSLIYEDGSFSQHSLNYHRLMLHDYLWALRLGDLNGQSLSDELKDRVQLAGEFLYQLQDEETGQVPCYGQNDGALILPLNNCHCRDFRPVIGAVHYYFSGERLFEHGPWDEDLLWLFGPDALSASVKEKPRQDLKATEGGYYTCAAKPDLPW